MQSNRHHFSGLLAAAIGYAAIGLYSGKAAANPVNEAISWIARVINPELVRIENEIVQLQNQLFDQAKSNDTPLKIALGYRGGSQIGSPDPTITLDLGAPCWIDKIFLVPAQRESSEDTGLFPKRFVIETSKHEDFSVSHVVYRSEDSPYQEPHAAPAIFNAQALGQFVRLTVTEGHHGEDSDLFALSEIVVTSNGVPVSFKSKVKVEGQIQIPNLWFPEALVDGRTPLGIWHSGTARPQNAGDVSKVINDAEVTIWTLETNPKTPIDYLVLYPYQVSRAFQISVLPEVITIRAIREKGGKPETLVEWVNPLPGSSQTSPVVIPLHGITANQIRIRASRPWLMGDQRLHALSEIEAWSKNVNVAKGRRILREFNGERVSVNSLTDGFSSEKKIIPVGSWLEQLSERSRIERELIILKISQRQETAKSELRATLGSVITLGLAVLIPVVVAAKRSRLASEEELDKIRNRIASDLHDDIGSNLGSISLIARTARKDLARLNGPEEIVEDLDELETIARESALAMRDIVWLLERQHDSVGDLVERMRETAKRLLREIRFTLVCESTRTSARLTLDGKRHLFLFYKEAIHNVLKHSRANYVAVRMWDEEDSLALEINDNGIGMPDVAHSHENASKLQERARLLNGNLQIASSEGEGTSIRLFVKHSNFAHQPTTP